MSIERGMFLYPWDLLDNGMEPVIAQLKRMGITYVSLAVLYHKAKLLLLNNTKHHMYRTEGGLCFYNTNQKRYGRLRPMKSPLLEAYSGDFLEHAALCFKNAGIRLGAWVVMFHNDYMAEKYQDIALQNCFGESSHTNLCPSNPEVYEYGLNIIRELAAYGIDEVHLESVDYGGFLHGDHHEMQAFGDMAGLEKMMGICYCPQCRQRAGEMGIDVEKLLSLARREAEDFFHFRVPSYYHEEYEKLFCSYRLMRQKQIAAFYRDAHRLLKKRGLQIKMKPILWLSGGSNPCFYGVDMYQAGEFTDGVIAVYPESEISVSEFVGRVKTLVPDSVTVAGGVRLMWPETRNPRQVTRYGEAYRQCGIRNVIFYNYGMAPMPLLKELEVIGL